MNIVCRSVKAQEYLLRQSGGICEMKPHMNVDRSYLPSSSYSRSWAIPLCSMLAVGMVSFVNVVSAHDITLGSEGVTDFTCDAFADWDTARSVVLASFPHAHNCVINGSADLVNPSGNNSDETYHITVSMDNANPLLNNAAARTVELRDQSGVNDPNRWPVSTTSRVVAGANASHTFRLQCRKNISGNTNLVIEDSSLNVVCLQQ